MEKKNIKKQLVPKKRLKEMMSWLNKNPGKKQKDFVKEVLEKEKELEIMKPEKKKKRKPFERFKERKGVKLNRLNEVLEHFLGKKAEIENRTDGIVKIEKDRILIDKTIITTRGIASVVVAQGIIQSDKSDKNKLEEFKKIFGKPFNLKLLK